MLKYHLFKFLKEVNGLIFSVKWSGISYMVEWFSLLAVGTSMLGTLLSFSSFFKEQLSNIFSDLSTREALKVISSQSLI